MATPDEPMGIQALNDMFRRISDIPFDVLSQALTEMAEVACEKVRSTGESMGVRDPESDDHVLDHVKLSGKPKKTSFGGYQNITFAGSRTRKDAKVRNAEIAFINEYGRRGQPARPFIRTALSQYETAICSPGIETISGWIEENT